MQLTASVKALRSQGGSLLKSRRTCTFSLVHVCHGCQSPVGAAETRASKQAHDPRIGKRMVARAVREGRLERIVSNRRERLRKLENSSLEKSYAAI